MRSKLFAVALCSVAVQALFAAPITTEGTGIGKHGEISVAVTFDDGRIQDVKILKEKENPILAKPVYTDLKAAVIDANSINVDVLSGATFTSQGFLNAIEDAAAKAGLKLSGKKATVKKVGDDALPLEQTADVVVIGAGGAGLAAAIEAKAAGANVIVLEKMPTVGGNSLVSGGEINITGSWVQDELGIEDNVARHVSDTLVGGDFEGDPEMVTLMCTQSGDIGTWLKDTIGVRFEEKHIFQFGGHTRPRAITPVGQSGAEPIAKLTAYAEKAGVRILTNMNAEEILQKNGRVVGVKAVRDGKTYTFNAKGGVVLASGGFGANLDMCNKYNKSIDSRFKSTDSPSATGEALYMAEKIGAQLVNMEYIQTYPFADPISGSLQYITDPIFDGAILVNQNGERFVEELERRDVKSQAILAQPGSYAYVLWNDAINDIHKYTDVHKNEFIVSQKNGVMIVAGTLKEAAEFFKVDPIKLQATVDRVNGFAKSGHDDDFNHRAGLKEMTSGKWYMVKTVPSVHHTMGGIKTNTKAEVLDAAGKPIPGFWAAGECTGTIHGTNRLGANAWLDILVFGRIAGRNAAETID